MNSISLYRILRQRWTGSLGTDRRTAERPVLFPIEDVKETTGSG